MDLAFFYTDLAYFTVPPVVIALFAAIYAFSVYIDDHYSSQFDTHATFEGNPLWRDKYGLFRLALNVEISSAVGGALLILSIVTSSQVSFALIGMGIPRIIYALTKLRKDLTYFRGQQIAFLDELKAVPNDPARIAAFFSSNYRLQSGLGTAGDIVRISGGRVFYPMFAWLYSTNPDIEIAHAECRQKIWDFAQNPVFPDR